MLINYELLKTFLAAAETGSFRKAAEQRFVTISAVSQQIKTLETQMGLGLFERLGRRVTLSDEGAALATALRPAFGQIDDALEGTQHSRRRLAGLLRVGAPRTFGRYWVRPRLAELLKRHPELSLRLELEVPTLLERRLSEGQLDVAILARRPALATTEAQVIAVERFEAVGSRGYLKRWGTPTQLADFQAHRWGVFDPDLAMHGPWWRAWFGPRAPLPARIVAEVPSLDELLALAVAGVCLTVLPSYLTAELVRSGRLERLEPALPAARRKKRSVSNEIYLGWRRGAIASARLNALRAALAGDGTQRRDTRAPHRDRRNLFAVN
jgi:DNA-binding transcriptional LysR family regulator